MGDVFRSICQSNHRPNQMEHISGRIVIALLSESKNKLSLPYAIFAQAGCKNISLSNLKSMNKLFLMVGLPFFFSLSFSVIPNKDENSLAWGLFGRIGVSLMLRYHKTHQWAKVNKALAMLPLGEETLKKRSRISRPAHL